MSDDVGHRRMTTGLVALTLRWAANEVPDAESGSMLLDAAIDLENSDLSSSWTCPLCEELDCDPNCPVRAVRPQP